MSFGHAVTGALLATKLAAPPRGAPIEVVQALTAAALRAGLLEVTYQGAKIGDPSDHRLDRVFGKISDFRGSSFAPPTAGPDVETRVEVAANLGKLTGTKPPIDTAGLAAALREFFAPDREACSTIGAGLMGADLPVPDSVTRLQNIVASFRQASDADVVTTAAARLGRPRRRPRDRPQAGRTRSTTTCHWSARRARRSRQAARASRPTAAARSSRELADLLAAGDLLSHRGEIKELTTEGSRRPTARRDRGSRPAHQQAR